MFPPEQAIGSTIKIRLEMAHGEPVLMRLAQLDFMDDLPGTPVAIPRDQPAANLGLRQFRRRPVAMDGAGSGPHLMGLIYHDYVLHEYAYDRDSKFGRLDKALSKAEANGWTVVSVKSWKIVFPLMQPQLRY